MGHEIWCKHALTSSGWQQDVLITINGNGIIDKVQAGAKPAATRVGIALPSPANLHSHAFQRAMAGMSEARGQDPHDSFWTWRKIMYAFLDHLSPDDVETINAFVQMEMLEAGYASVGEFHYVHHQSSGASYTSVAEMSNRVIAAAANSGIGLTLLPVMYEQGGCDGRPLGAGQLRFGNDPERYARLHAEAQTTLGKLLPADARIGVAPHSLRAVSEAGLQAACDMAAGRPLHIHIAEQQAEVDEVLGARGARPVQWLLENHPVDNTWCLVHATHMLEEETVTMAKSGAVAGLCPITESNLGDGIFDGERYVAGSGNWGIGSDSNVRISLSEELRTLEYSQRLQLGKRAVLATTAQSTGRVLYESACKGGALAMQRDTGAIEPGKLADIVALDANANQFLCVSDDGWLDSWIFAADDSMVTDVWSAGRHLVTEGRHKAHDEISKDFRNTLQALASRL